MRIKWLGHSSFLITADDGTRIITDPYKSGAYDGALAYGPIDQPADVVTISHEHPDHGYAEAVAGSPILIRGAGEFMASGIEFHGMPAYHDTTEGADRGTIVVYRFTVDGVRICHLGDLGHVLTSDQAAEIGAVDVLLAPVGGYFTIGPDEAWKVADQLSAHVVIPMHYLTEKCAFPLAKVDQFVEGKKNVQFVRSSEIGISADRIPEEREIVVLEHAL